VRVDIHANRGRVDVIGRAIDGVEVDDADGDDLRVTPHGNRVDIHGNDVDCDITVPEDAAVSVHLNNAEVFVHNVASVEVHLNNGDIEVHDVDGRVGIHANKADVGITNVGGPVDVRLNEGDVWVTVPPDCEVAADLHSLKGDVLNTTADGSDLRLKVNVNRGDITVGH
jgi:DUF4097 and DUF4098 domain-containing protein YvlB